VRPAAGSTTSSTTSSTTCSTTSKRHAWTGPDPTCQAPAASAGPCQGRQACLEAIMYVANNLSAQPAAADCITLTLMLGPSYDAMLSPAHHLITPYPQAIASKPQPYRSPASCNSCCHTLPPPRPNPQPRGCRNCHTSAMLHLSLAAAGRPARRSTRCRLRRAVKQPKVRAPVAHHIKVRCQPGLPHHAGSVATHQHGPASLQSVVVVQVIGVGVAGDGSLVGGHLAIVLAQSLQSAGQLEEPAGGGDG
jgi:hypothetical protein